MADKILSVFIDESGDFGPYDAAAPYYLVAMILHNQDVNITENISLMDEHIDRLGYPNHAIHTGPLIRRESVYANELMEDRKRLIRKIECSDVIAMTGKLSKAITLEIMKHEDFWNSFDKLIVYYDNGQVELTKILSSVFNVLYPNVEFRKVRPVDYRLFQVADLICTMELLSEKAESNSFTKSETEFFGSVRDFKKNYYKWILKKKL